MSSSIDSNADASTESSLTIPPMSLGISIHFNKPQQNDIEMIASAGFGFVRTDFAWIFIEKQKGVYDFSGYEDLVDALAEHHLRPVFIPGYGNPLYEHSNKPHYILGPATDEVQQGYAAFAAQAAAKFQGRGVVWEIWNEPNVPISWEPKPDVNNYMKLATTAITAMRQADATATIIAPNVTTNLTIPPQGDSDPWKFLTSCFESGLLEQVDAISIHPYRDNSKPPETAADDYQRLRGLIAQHASEDKKNLPIISSEWGYPSAGQLTSQDQAVYLARQFLTNFINGIPLSIWYDWQEGPNTNYGIVTSNYKPKPAYHAVQTLTNTLSGFSFVQRLPLPSKDDYVAVFQQGAVQKLAVWTVATPHNVTLPVDVNTPFVTSVSLAGDESALATTRGQLVIQLAHSPQFVLT